MKKIWWISGIVVLVIILVVIFSGQKPIQKTGEVISGIQTSGDYLEVSPSQAMDLIDSTEDLVIIDVSPYYAEGHLPGAVSYPVGSGMLDEVIPSLDKSKTYLVYCHGETPSRLGAQKLVDAGFTKVYRLSGEYDAWVNAGYPVAY